MLTRLRRAKTREQKKLVFAKRRKSLSPTLANRPSARGSSTSGGTHERSISRTEQLKNGGTQARKNSRTEEFKNGAPPRHQTHTPHRRKNSTARHDRAVRCKNERGAVKLSIYLDTHPSVRGDRARIQTVMSQQSAAGGGESVAKDG